ncbi:MAG: Asp23/Gls24 family envelope stress response protein [Oscillospiraceae bacterium]|nr:Asp23/Gls24 family envelope stress response protein [Oscillospiraceae bacterium]
MGEGREYIFQAEEGGSIQISEDVIATIAAVSATEVEGCSLSANLGSDIAELLGKRNAGKGIKVRLEENEATIDVAILIAYGFPIQEVAKQVQEAVTNGLEAMASLTVRAVNVHVSGILFPKEQKQRSGKRN